MHTESLSIIPTSATVRNTRNTFPKQQSNSQQLLILVSREQISDALSALRSAFAMREPNCIARFGRVTPSTSPSLLAASRSKSLSPTPLARDRSAYKYKHRKILLYSFTVNNSQRVIKKLCDAFHKPQHWRSQVLEAGGGALET